MSSLRRRERRISILNAARRIMARKGIFGARADEIAREADVSPGLLFQYFPSMRVLQNAVLAKGLTALVNPWPMKSSELPPRLAVETITSHFISIVKDDPDGLRLALYGALSGHPNSVKPFRKHCLRTIRQLRTLIHGWRRVGTVRGPVNARDTGLLFTFALVGAVLEQAILGGDRERGTPRRLTSAFVQLLESHPEESRQDPNGGQVVRSMASWSSYRPARNGTSRRLARRKKGRPIS
jgi:AcrR family transcriptional regulator